MIAYARISNVSYALHTENNTDGSIVIDGPLSTVTSLVPADSNHGHTSDEAVLTGLLAPQNLVATQTAPDTFTLTWDPVAAARAYDLRRYREGVAEPVIHTEIVGTTYEDTGLEPAEYFYDVRSVGD